MTIQYNDELRDALLGEMQRVSSLYRIPNIPNKWMNHEAEAYHESMYRVLELMVHCPISISVDDNYEK